MKKFKEETKMLMSKEQQTDFSNLIIDVLIHFEKEGPYKYYLKLPGSGVSAVFEDGKYVGWYRYE